MSQPEVILGKPLTEEEEWLAHIVRKQERDRIIELLYEDKLFVFGCGCCAEATIEDLVTLIKGENK